MKYIIDEIPIYFPKCGKETKIKDHVLIANDFIMGCCGQCDCGAQFQHVKTEAIIEVAADYGDSGRYWEEVIEKPSNVIEFQKKKKKNLLTSLNLLEVS